MILRNLIKSFRTWMLVVSLSALLLAACGEGSEGDTSASSPTDTASTSTQPATQGTSTTVAASAAPDLVGTSWSVTEYVLENGSLTNLWPGTEIMLRFEASGVVAGFSGCNDYQGSYEASGPYDEFVEGTRDPNDGQAIEINDLSVTEKACDSPNNVMDQETEYLDALQQVGRWVVVRGSLSLRTADGFVLIFADPVG